MDIIFVRHGVPDYTLSDARQMTHLEKDYAPLDRAHLRPIHDLPEQFSKLKPDAILSSPYTRALQTAEIINRKLKLELFVEHDLREWKADKLGGYISLEERDRRWLEYRNALKQRVHQPEKSYESHQELRSRVLNVLERYAHYSTVVVVSHFNVYESLVGHQENSMQCADYRLMTLRDCT